MKLTENSQNRTMCFNKMQKENKFSNIHFENKKPQNQLEREYFKTLNIILRELEIKGVLTWKREIFKMLKHKRFILQREGWHIEINNSLYHFSINQDMGKCEYINLDIKASLIWHIFGKHYTGSKLKNSLNSENKLKVDLLRMWAEKYSLFIRVQKLESQISKVAPVKGISIKARVNAFMRRKTTY